jgi:o-succinylbenzoate---CoA ligase
VSSSEQEIQLEGGPGELVAVDLPPGPRWLDVVARLWFAGAAVLPLDHRLTDAEKRVVIDRARPSALITVDESTVFIGDAVDETIGLVMVTSGAGGVPKLVELSRVAISASVHGSAQTLGTTPEDPWVACLTPAHIGGMLVLLRGLVLGAPVEVHERFDMERLARATEGASVSLVPSMLRRLVDARVDLSRFRTVLVGGDALDERLAREAGALGARVVTTYGMTETCGGVVYDGSCFPGTRARIAPGEDQIELRGPTLMEGYRHDPGATGAAFTVDGWLRTGDVGALDADEQGDTRLTVHGRLQDAIRTGGEKVWPREVERALADHPKVADVAVVGRPDPEWGQHVTAYVVPVDAADPPSLNELRDHAADRVARFKAPRRLHLVDAIPRTPGGKIRRGDL